MNGRKAKLSTESPTIFQETVAAVEVCPTWPREESQNCMPSAKKRWLRSSYSPLLEIWCQLWLIRDELQTRAEDFSEMSADPLMCQLCSMSFTGISLTPTGSAELGHFILWAQLLSWIVTGTHFWCNSHKWLRGLSCTFEKGLLNRMSLHVQMYYIKIMHTLSHTLLFILYTYSISICASVVGGAQRISTETSPLLSVSRFMISLLSGSQYNLSLLLVSASVGI